MSYRSRDRTVGHALRVDVRMPLLDENNARRFEEFQVALSMSTVLGASISRGYG
jgi:hypothetical protein